MTGATDINIDCFSEAGLISLGQRPMSRLVYNRLPDVTPVDTTTRGSFRGVLPDTTIKPTDTPQEIELKRLLAKALPQHRFKEEEKGIFVLPVTSRKLRGRKAAKHLRKENEITAILFGGNPKEQPPELLKLKTGNIVSLLAGRGLMGHDYILDIKDQNRQVRVTPHICQFHPVTDVPINITFYRWKQPAPPAPKLSLNQRFPSNAQKAFKALAKEWNRKSPRVPTTWRTPLGPTFATRERREKQRCSSIEAIGKFYCIPQSETRLQSSEVPAAESSQ